MQIHFQILDIIRSKKKSTKEKSTEIKMISWLSQSKFCSKLKPIKKYTSKILEFDFSCGLNYYKKTVKIQDDYQVQNYCLYKI